MKLIRVLEFKTRSLNLKKKHEKSTDDSMDVHSFDLLEAGIGFNGLDNISMGYGSKIPMTNTRRISKLTMSMECSRRNPSKLRPQNIQHFEPRIKCFIRQPENPLKSFPHKPEQQAGSGEEGIGLTHRRGWPGRREEGTASSSGRGQGGEIERPGRTDVAVAPDPTLRRRWWRDGTRSSSFLSLPSYRLNSPLDPKDGLNTNNRG